MLRRSTAAGLLLALVVALPALAQSTYFDAVAGQSYVFASVDAYEFQGAYILVTGVLQGESETTRIRFVNWRVDSTEGSQRCERLALMSLSKPGRYLFAVTMSQYSGSPPQACKLTLVR